MRGSLRTNISKKRKRTIKETSKSQLSNKQKDSNNRKKTQIVLQGLSGENNQQERCLYPLYNHKLLTYFDKLIFMEDLNVKGMMKIIILQKAIQRG